jgi:hypothetical protein
MFFPFAISLSILLSILHVYAYLNDTSNADLTWSGNSAHPLSSNSSQWCYFPAANVTKNTACIGTSSSSTSSYQTLIYTHLNLPQGWSIAYYALSQNITLLGDFTYPVPAKGARMCLSGQAVDKSYQTYCQVVFYNNDIVDNESDWCVVALGQSYVSDGCYTAMPSSGTVSAATAPATTVTEAQPAATSGQSSALKLQECASGCGKSQCAFSNLVSVFLFWKRELLISPQSHADPVTYPVIVGTPVENCDPNSNATITSAIGGSVQITDTWSVTTSLGVSFKGLSLSVQGSYSSSKALTYSQTITIPIPPGQMV